MYILAFDTSTPQGALAILNENDVLSYKTWLRGKSHSEMLTPAIEEALQDAGVTLRKIDLLSVGIGPGSFTGIRVAVNAARTIAYSMSTPVFGFNTLEILTAALPASELPVIAIVNAHKNLLYTSRFEHQKDHWVASMEPAAISVERLEQIVQTPHICIGDGYDVFESLFSERLKTNLIRIETASDYPNAVVLGRLAQSRLTSTQPLDWKALQALYIRASEAEERLQEGLLKLPPKL